MATFTEIYYNGNEYKEMWLNGSKIWEKTTSIEYPYPDADCVVSYYFYSYEVGVSTTETFTVIDSSLPYSVNGNSTNTYTFPTGVTKVKLINLKPIESLNYQFYPTNIEQLRIPNLTDLSYLFAYFCYNSKYSWQPEYFKFNENPTNMSHMFYQCKYLTDEMMAQFMPYFPNTNQVTNMSSIFGSCSSLTSLNISNFDTSNVESMYDMFVGCEKLTSLNVSNFDTSQVTSMGEMFDDCSSLTSLDLSNFNTSKVASMTSMFRGCNSLTSLDLSSFDTSNVISMYMMFSYCSSLTSLDLSSFDTNKVTDAGNMFTNVKNCTIYIGANWTLDTSSSAYGGSNLTFIRVVPITNITLESTLTDTTITKGTQFTITPTITPTDYSGDELVITYDENYLSMVDNTFTVLDTATIGQQLDITYSSKNNPSVSATYSVTIRDFATIESIVLQHSLESLVIEPNTTFTITPIITPTVHDDELMIEFDNTYITNDNGTFTITNAPFSEQLSIRYYSKLNPTVSATLDLTVREFIPITSISLTHTLESLTDVAIGTTFTVVPTVEPLSYDDELLVDYDTSYLSKDGDNYTVLSGASGQTVQVIYYSKHNNNVNAMLEFTVASKAEREPIVTTYTTFNKVSNSSYCSFTTDTEANTVTIKYTYTGSSYTHSTINAKLDTILPRKCRVRITGESQGTYRYMNVDGVIYPTNSIISLSARETLNNAWWGTHSMPSDGIVYNNGATQTTSEALDYNEISLYQLNPNQYYLANDSSNFYPFEYDFTYCFPSEPRLYLNYATHYGGTKGTLYSNTYVTYKDLKIEVYEYLIESIYLTIDEDVNNITNAKFTINSTILPSLYSDNDLEVIYDETYMEIDVNTGEVKLKNGCQGLTHTVTYRSKSDNSISKSITFTVSQDLEIGMDAIDFTQSTAPTLPDCMTLDGQGSSYYFSHGTYTTNVYGLVPNNSGKHSSTAYTRYKYVAPKDGALTFTYRCYAETNYDYLTVHVDTSTSQPSYSSSTNQVFTTKGVSSYQTKDGTASVNVTSGTTYYIHIQYHKDGSASSGYDKGCIRKIELL